MGSGIKFFTPITRNDKISQTWNIKNPTETNSTSWNWNGISNSNSVLSSKKKTHRAHYIEIKRQNSNPSWFIFFKFHKIWWAKKSATFRAYLFCAYRGNVAKIFIVHLQKERHQLSIILWKHWYLNICIEKPIK